ncbi:MAG: hypothetical protein RDU41_05915 [Clostridia bacterium]|nr:hypothetical protein [Clostridia bacterium]
MWHRLQLLVTKAQAAWLRAESATRGKSIGQIIRDLIDKERDRQDGRQNPPK